MIIGSVDKTAETQENPALDRIFPSHYNIFES